MRTGWMKLLYVLLLVAAVLFFVLYSGVFSVFLLVILLTIPILMLVSLLYQRFHLKTVLMPAEEAFHRNIPERMQLVVENTGFLPIGRAEASILCMSAGSSMAVPIQVNFPIPARDKVVVTFRVTAVHCGSASFSLEWLKFTDYLHLFGCKCRKHPKAQTAVLPLGQEQVMSIAVAGSLTDEDSTIFEKNRSGDDPSEVYKIREYQPGDIPKRIHWKLSARTDTLWVKEYSAPIQQRAVILIDYRMPEHPSALDAMDVVMESAYALACSFLKQEIPFTLYWLDKASGKLMWNEAHTMAELHDALCTLLKQEPNEPTANEQTDEFLVQAVRQPAVHKTQALFYITPQLTDISYGMLAQTFSQQSASVLDVLETDTTGSSIPVYHTSLNTIPEVMQQLGSRQNRR